MNMKRMKTAHISKVLTMIFFGSLATTSFSGSATERIERLEATVYALEKRISALEGSSVQAQRKLSKPEVYGDWKNKSNWRLLSKGMLKEQVRIILGEPEKIDASGAFENWRWRYPFGPSVTFYNEQVYGWHEK